MKFFIVLSALVAAAMAKPGYVSGLTGYSSVIAPLAYARVVPGAPIGPDGRVVDTPEVAVAKAANAAAHINEKVTLANEAAKNYGAYSAVVPAAAYSTYAAAPVVSAYSAPALAYGKVYSGISPVVSAYSAYGYGAPLGYDGRVVDTPEVTVAKAAHFAAHAEANARTAYAGHYGYAGNYGYAGHYGYAAPSVSIW